MTTRWDIAGIDEVRALLDKAENLALDGSAADAFDYLVEAIDDDLWSRSSSHEALRLWCLCCEILEERLQK